MCNQRAQSFQFSEYRSFASLLTFTLVYFIISNRSTNGAILLFFPSYILYLVYINTTDSYISFYHLKLSQLNWKFLGIFGIFYDFPVIVKWWLFFFFSFQFEFFFISSCLIAGAKISNTMLNKSGWSGQSCLVHDFRRTDFSFSLSCIMLSVTFSVYVLYYAEVWVVHFLGI